MESWNRIKDYLEDLYPAHGSCLSRCDTLSRSLPTEDIYAVRLACKQICRDDSVKSSSACLNACNERCESSEGRKICLESCLQRPDIH